MKNPPPDEDSPNTSPLIWLIDIRRSEWRSVGYAFLWFMFLMMAYNLLRPIRETFATALGKQATGRLFLYTFIVLLIAVPVFAWAKNTFAKRYLVPVVFHFFASHLAIFALLSWKFQSTYWLGVVFFVWVSVFIMFVVSLLWSLLADIFNSEQAKRLFGPIASGATVGALVGSATASQLGKSLGVTVLFVMAFVLLELSIVFATMLQREAVKNEDLQTPDEQSKNEVLKGKPKEEGFSALWSGLTNIAGSRYLILICFYVVLSQLFGTFVYFLLNETVALQIPDELDRLSHFGTINFAAQFGTLLMQTLIVSRVVKFLGVSVALIVGPLVSLTCMAGILTSPTLLLVSVVDVVNRLATYGVTVPAKEMLFSVVDDESKYKSKSFIDTVVVRGSDVLAGNLPLREVHIIPLIIGGGVTGWILGRLRAKKEAAIQGEANLTS